MKILFLTSNSICIELVNDDIYETKEYDIFLNGKYYMSSNKNVFSIYNLVPNKEYNIKINDKEISFKTLNKKMIVVNPKSNDDTKYIQEKINELLPDEVLCLEGTFYVSSMFVGSNKNIYIPKGSIIYGLLEREKYDVLSSNEFVNNKPLGTWEGRCDDSFASIFTFISAEDSSLYGEGIIDYRSQLTDWWINHRIKRIARRPKGIFIHTSKNITISGLTIKNTPSWNQHAFYSENINYYNLYLENPSDSPTTDGCDPEASENINIIGNIISVGDDCIAIKSSKIELASIYKVPAKNITIRNNLMLNGHAGITIGSEMSGGIIGINASKNIFRKTDRGLRIKTQRGRGNVSIGNIIFENIIMDGVLSPFVINAFYKAGNDDFDWRFDDKKIPMDDKTPTLGKFIFKNIKCYNVSYGLGYFLGLPENYIKEIILENIDVSYNKDSNEGIMAMNPRNQKFKNIGLYLENVELISLKNIRYIDNPNEAIISKNVIRINNEK